MTQLGTPFRASHETGRGSWPLQATHSHPIQRPTFVSAEIHEIPLSDLETGKFPPPAAFPASATALILAFSIDDVDRGVRGLS
jgi:hypothetical protein